MDRWCEPGTRRHDTLALKYGWPHNLRPAPGGLAVAAHCKPVQPSRASHGPNPGRAIPGPIRGRRTSSILK